MGGKAFSPALRGDGQRSGPSSVTVRGLVGARDAVDLRLVFLFLHMGGLIGKKMNFGGEICRRSVCKPGGVTPLVSFLEFVMFVSLRRRNDFELRFAPFSK